MSDDVTIPCETCGEPTNMTATKRCTNCWEVEHRMSRYLKSEGGRKFVRMMLQTVQPDEGGSVNANP